eukprot:scaffold242705_cov51-Attheya_sp.AAC.1
MSNEEERRDFLLAGACGRNTKRPPENAHAHPRSASGRAQSSQPDNFAPKVGHVGDEDLAQLTNINTHRRLTEESGGYELGTPLWQYEGQTGKSFNGGPMVWARRTQYLVVLRYPVL